MKTIFRILPSTLILIGFCSLLATDSLACKPSLELSFVVYTKKTTNCRFTLKGANIGGGRSILDRIRNSSPGCRDLNLNDEEQNFFAGIIRRVGDREVAFSTGRFVRQTEKEYVALKHQIEKSNKDRCTCHESGDVSRGAGWTFYTNTMSCSNTSDCAPIYPPGCLKTSYENGENGTETAKEGRTDILWITAVLLTIAAVLFVFTALIVTAILLYRFSRKSKM